jgi:ribosomal protein S18 acetylase RimI-like enzyme
MIPPGISRHRHVATRGELHYTGAGENGFAMAKKQAIKDNSVEIHVRRATDHDYAGLCGLYDEIDTFHRVNLPDIFKKPDGSPREKDVYLGRIADEQVGFFVAEADQELVGFIQILVRETPDIPILIQQHYAVIDEIMIKSEFQKRGLGRILMEKAQEWAIAKGAEFIELNVYEFNQNAISFYERLGYQTSSRKMRKSLRNDTAG